MLDALEALLANVFPAEALYAVGGSVRDRLRGMSGTPKDRDYVIVGLTVDEVERRLRTIGNVDRVGASFAVLKFSSPSGQADIAIPRRERSTGLGHREFDVQSGPEVPLIDDLARRDFRMNMIARRVADGELVDPYDGAVDIRARRIDILGEATFREDPLRMLRAAQFAARFGFRLTARTQAAMLAAGPLVRTVSPERVCDELSKLFLLAPAPSIGIDVLRVGGVLDHLWPEILEGVGVEQNAYHAYDVYRHNLVTLDATPPGDVTLRLAALLHDVGKPRTKVDGHFYGHELVGADLSVAMLERFRFPGAVVETVEGLVRAHMYVADPELAPRSLRRFIRRVQADRLDRLFALRAADIVGSGLPKRGDANERFAERVRDVLAERPPLAVRDLAIGGADIIGLLVSTARAPAGFRGDSRVGAVLGSLLEEVVDDPNRNERATLMESARRYFAELPASEESQ